MPSESHSHPADVPAESSSAELRSLLGRNLSRVRARIDAACRGDAATSGQQARTERLAPELIAVTKTVPPHVALALSELLASEEHPMTHLAENRAESLDRKVEAFAAASKTARWHFIGHIQRNKARRIVERSDVLQSIDSPKLAATVARLADELERDLEVFVEVNLTGETEKHGLLPAEIQDVLEALTASKRIQIAGLMAMGPARQLRTVDEVFGDVADLARDLESRVPGLFKNGTCLLSMGMSGDLEAAIRHGSDLVRIGSALFEDVNLAPTSSPGPSSR